MTSRIMRDDRPDPEAHALVGAFALDAMDESERRSFEAHLRTCETCRIEAEELTATAVLLGQAVPMDPPAAMRAHVLDRIDAIRQVPPAVPFTRPRKVPQWQSLPAAAAAVAAVVVLTLGGLYARTNSELRALQTVAAAEGVGDDLLSVLSSADARVSEPTAFNGGSARFVWTDDGDQGVLVASGLPDPPAGRTYALWLIRGETAQYAGSFVPDRGQAAAVVSGDVRTAQTLGVTAEPAGTITQPTGALLMSTALG